MTMDEIVIALAKSNPIGIVDYGRDYSDLTPGMGPMYRCIYCKSDYVFPKALMIGHENNCIWLMANKWLQAKIDNGDIVQEK